MKMRLSGIIFGFFLVSCGALAQGVTVEKDVVYGRVGDVELKMDIARPPASDAPFPALVCIHGGAWQAGSKDGYAPFIERFASNGYVTAAVAYRFAPKHPWPAQIEDVKCAVRYLRANARELNINPEKIAALGDSAGGHLALLLGLMAPGDGLEGEGGNPGFSSKVQAVINLFGPTDMRTWRVLPEAEGEFRKNTGKGTDEILQDLVGTVDRAAPVMAQVSPIVYVDAGDPPILTFHGTTDPIVPFEQALSMHEALKKAGVQEKLVVMEGAGHGWEGAQLLQTLIEGFMFLDGVMKSPAPASP